MKVIHKEYWLTADERRTFCEKDNYGAWWDEQAKGWFIAWMNENGSYVGPFDSQLEAMIEHDRIGQEGGLTRGQCFHFFTASGWKRITETLGLALEAMLDDPFRYFTPRAVWRIEKQMLREAQN
jgi:hypothetical protein